MFTSLATQWNSFNRNVRLHFLVVGLFTLTLDGGIYTVIFNLFMLRLGFGPQAVGTVNAVGMLAFALASLPVGRMGEKWGFRRMIMAGTALCALGTLLVVFTEFVSPASQIPLMVIAVIFVFTGLAAFFVNMVPYMVAFTDTHSRTGAFAIQSALGSVFAFVGSLIGGNLPGVVASLTGSTLQSPLPYRYTLLLVPLLLLVGLYLNRIMRDPPSAPLEVNTSHPPATDATKAAALKTFLGLIALFAMIRFMQVAFIGGASTFFNVYMDTQLAASTANIGLIQAAARLLGIPVSLIMPALSKKFGNIGVCIGASFLTAACALPMAFAPVWWVAGMGYIVLGVCTSLRYNTFMVYSMERTPAHLRGSGNGAQEMSAGFSFALIALFGGILVAPLGYAFIFLSTAAITVVGTLVLWAYVRRSSQQPLAQATEAKT